MKTSNHIQHGFINARGIEKAKKNRKCRNRDCFNYIEKGQKVIKVSDGLLCCRCSQIGIDANIQRIQKDLVKLKGWLLEVDLRDDSLT